MGAVVVDVDVNGGDVDEGPDSMTRGDSILVGKRYREAVVLLTRPLVVDGVAVINVVPGAVVGAKVLVLVEGGSPFLPRVLGDCSYFESSGCGSISTSVILSPIIILVLVLVVVGVGVGV